MLAVPSHPAANAFPLMTEPDYANLVADIKNNGLVDDIIRIRDGKNWLILDGRHRDRACAELGITPRYREYDGDDPIAFVVSVNLRRRHLNDSQRALVAARLASLAPGRPKKRGNVAGFSQADAARALHVGERTLREAKAALSRGVPEVVAAIEKGEITVHEAAELARLGRKEQRQHLSDRVAGGGAGVRPLCLRSSSIALGETDVVALSALAEVGDESRNPRARAGARVLRRIVPSVQAR